MNYRIKIYPLTIQKKNLFAGARVKTAPAPAPTQTPQSKAAAREERKEIHNGYLEQREAKKIEINSSPERSSIPKNIIPDKEKEPVAIIDLENEIEEDWSAVPAFLRRKK